MAELHVGDVCKVYKPDSFGQDWKAGKHTRLTILDERLEPYTTLTMHLNIVTRALTCARMLAHLHGLMLEYFQNVLSILDVACLAGCLLLRSALCFNIWKNRCFVSSGTQTCCCLSLPMKFATKMY